MSTMVEAQIVEAHDVTQVLAPKLLLTPVEAAHALGVSRTILFRLIGTGELDSIKVGGSRRIPVTALHAYIERLSGR